VAFLGLTPAACAGSPMPAPPSPAELSRNSRSVAPS
jgi:hypothetical protein